MQLYILSCNTTTLGGKYYNSYFTDKETGAQGVQVLLKENIMWQELELGMLGFNPNTFSTTPHHL